MSWRTFPLTENSDKVISESRMERKEIREQCDAHAFLRELREHSNRVRHGGPVHRHVPAITSAMQFPLAERFSVHETNTGMLAQLLWVFELFTLCQICPRGEEAARKCPDPARPE